MNEEESVIFISYKTILMNFIKSEIHKNLNIDKPIEKLKIEILTHMDDFFVKEMKFLIRNITLKK